MTLRFSQRVVMIFAHPFTKRDISPTFYEIIPGVIAIGCGHRIKGSQLRSPLVTMTLSRHGCIKCIAHHLTEANIKPKLNENPSSIKELWDGHEIQFSITLLHM